MVLVCALLAATVLVLSGTHAVTARALRTAAESHLQAAELAETYRQELEHRDAIDDARPLAGRAVVVNTPKPDDQSVRGIVVRELDTGGLILTDAVYLEQTREGIREIPTPGPVVIPAYSSAQVIEATQPANDDRIPV